MKKILSFALAVSMLLSLTACGENTSTTAKYDIPEKLSADGYEHKECDIIVEAEDGGLWGGNSVQTSKSGYSGSGYAQIRSNSDFEISVVLPSSQYYTITAVHCADDHKENSLVFNGAKVLDMVSSAGGWAETVAEGVFLEEGENVITLGDGWSWFCLDYIRIQDGESISDEIYSGITRQLCNPNANPKTQRIYNYLCDIYGKRTLAGQCTDYGHNTEIDALYKGLGKKPAVRAFDFIFDSYSYCNGKPKAEDVELAKKWSKDGGIVVYDWHWYAPCGGTAFYTADTSFSLSNAVTDLDIASTPLDELKAMYKNKEISEETYKIVRDLDLTASMLLDLQKENVTVLWRPLHEASGGWFWWGASGSESYKWLWKLMYDRYTNYHKLNNLIWVWNAQDKDWYPGDEYCDIAATDIYPPAHDYSTNASAFAELAECTNGSKMVALSECGVMPDPDLIVRDNAYWLWFAVWNWDYIVVDGTPVLSDRYTSLEMMKKVYESEAIITLDELPNFN